MEDCEYQREKCKIRSKGSCGGHVTHFWNFGTTLISRGRLKLENSNLAQIWTAVTNNEKIQNYVKMGHVGVT